MTYEHVFQPLTIGPLTVKNRIEVSPAEPFLCTKDGLVTDEFIAFTAMMAKGGAGIVTVGDSPVTQTYADENHFVVNLADPFVVHGLTKLTDTIHRYGAVASIELNLRLHVFPADMTRDELKEIIGAFAGAAERCKKAGFDMVMIHGGHGHTVAQFYSPLMNKRTDEYGAQTFQNRCRFAGELLDAVRAAVGPGMAIEYRMSGDELTDGGVGIDEAVLFAKAIEDKIDLIHISAGNLYNPSSLVWAMQPTYLPTATNVRLAERMKKELSIPVTSVGSFNLALAEAALAAGQADMIAMIRQFIADPACVEKARIGRGDEIRPCIRCMVCTGDDPHGCPKPLRCTVNPVMGRHPLFDVIPKSQPPQKVVVIGGGAAGLEAARRCAQRGNTVVLFEKEPVLGGTLIAAGANALKADVRRYGEWSVRMTERTPGIDIRTGTAATRELVAAEKPDAVIVAVGSEPIIPDIPGSNNPNVCLASDVDLGKARVGKRVALIGAGLTGTETAVTLARDGHEVLLIDMLSLEQIDSRGNASRSVVNVLRRMAQEAGVTVMTGLTAREITDGALVAEDEAGTLVKLRCDSVVLSLGLRPRAALAAIFKDCAPQVYTIGDCAAKSGNITSAVLSGFYAAMNIS